MCWDIWLNDDSMRVISNGGIVVPCRLMF